MDLGTIRKLIEPVIGLLGYELVDIRFVVEQGRPTLRIFMDKEGGVTVGDCERVSREIETLLEVESVVRERYLLEVSSPGLNRPLVQEKDFSRFAGKTASLTTTEPVLEYGGRRNYKGLLKGVEDGKVVMESDGKEYRVSLNRIGKANLCYKI